MLKNKPACCFLALLLGIVAFTALGGILPIVCLLGITLAAFFWKKRFFALLCLCALAGVITMGVSQPNLMDYLSENAKITGYVSEQVGKQAYTLRDVHADGNRLSKGVRLTSEQPLTPGDVVEFTGSLRPYPPATNFGGTNWRQVMLGKGLSHFAYADHPLLTGRRTNAFTLFGSLRQKISSGIQACLGQEHSGLTIAILLGEKSGVDETVLADFRSSGLSHVLAISGLHIGIFVAFVCFLIRRLPPGLRVAIVALFLLCFLFLTCFSPSVLRAGVMAVLWLYADVRGYRYHLLTSLFTAGVVILLYNPYSLFSAGFLLSFGCVLGIGLFYGWFYQRLSWFCRPIRASIAMYAACQLGMFPVSLWFFNQIQSYSVLANIFAVPLVSFALVGVLVGVVVMPLGLSYAPLVFGYSVLEVISYVARVIASLPLSVLTLPTPPLVLVLGYYGLLLSCVICYFANKQAILALGTCAAGVMLLVNFHSFSRVPQITMLDVGDGLCVHIRTEHGRHIIVDGSADVQDENALVKYLRSIGANDLVLVCTHDDLDHYGGFIPVASEFRVATYLAPMLQGNPPYTQLIARLEAQGSQLLPFLAGADLELDGAVVQAIAPGSISLDAKNENSLNAYVIIKGKALLITGDTPIEQEVPYRKVDILQVAHHGSDTSTSDTMLEQTRPEIALVSGDKYIKQSVTSRLGRYYDTRRFGAVRLYLQDEITVDTMK